MSGGIWQPNMCGHHTHIANTFLYHRSNIKYISKYFFDKRNKIPFAILDIVSLALLGCQPDLDPRIHPQNHMLTPVGYIN